jgi:hypothetical protein
MLDTASIMTCRKACIGAMAVQSVSPSKYISENNLEGQGAVQVHFSIVIKLGSDVEGGAKMNWGMEPKSKGELRRKRRSMCGTYHRMAR